MSVLKLTSGLPVVFIALAGCASAVPQEIAVEPVVFRSGDLQIDPTNALSELDKPLLAIFGAKDRWVPVQESVDAIRKAVPDESMLTIYVSEASGHLMSGTDESAAYNGELPVEPEYFDVMVRWIVDL